MRTFRSSLAIAFALFAVSAAEALAPAPRPRAFGFFRRGAPSGPPTLSGVSDAMMSAAMAMQEADVAPTERQVAACDQARTRYGDIMDQWRTLEASARDALNGAEAGARRPSR